MSPGGSVGGGMGGGAGSGLSGGAGAGGAVTGASVAPAIATGPAMEHGQIENWSGARTGSSSLRHKIHAVIDGIAGRYWKKQ